MLLKEIPSEDYEEIGKLFNTPRGKKALEILDRHFYNTISFTPGEPDVTSFKEGHRDIIQIFHNAVKYKTEEEKD